MRITSHAMGTAFVDVQKDGEVKIAAMLYTKRGRTTVRLPMGKGKKTQRESLTDTQIREATQEAAQDPGNFSYAFEFPRFVYYQTVRDDKNPGEALHLKAFMVARVTQGELRNHRLVEEERDGEGKTIKEEEEILGPLVWYEVRDLLNLMSERGRGLPVHITAVLATLHALAGKYPAVAIRYENILVREEVQARIRPATDNKEEVARYVSCLQV